MNFLNNERLMHHIQNIINCLGYKNWGFTALVFSIFLFFSSISNAQDIVYIEYFMNSDPGLGNATELSIVSSPDLQNQTFTVDISELDVGFHSLYIRSKDENGLWSLTNCYTFYKQNFHESLVEIEYAEYFFNNDPGLGNGVSIPLTPGSQISNATFSASINELNSGFNHLFVRAKSSIGEWSLTNIQAFYKDIIPLSVSNIVKAEYYFNTDPGLGNGVNIPITPDQQIDGISFVADITGLDVGFHSLFLRAMNENLKWSHTNVSSFYLDYIPVVGQSIIAAEYFLDDDPGYGNGTSIPIVSSPLVENSQFSVDMSDLGNGFHNLYVRALRSDGRWSHTNLITFYKDVLDATVTEVIAAEYFIDTDPGLGNGSPIDIVPGQDIDVFVNVSLLNLETQGENRLYIRTKDSNGKWSHTNIIVFTIDKLITLNANPVNGGEVEGAGWYDYGYELTVVATPNEGFNFLNWTENGEQVSDMASYSFVVEDHRDLVAHFSMIDFQLTLLASPEASGILMGEGLYNLDDEVLIQATPVAGWRFLSWNMGEELISEAASFTYTMPAENVALTAHFEAIPMYSLTLTVSPADAGTVSGAGDYEEGAQVPITATASAGYQFVSWNMGEEVISEASSFTYTMPAEDVTLTAHFEAIPMYSLTLTVSPADAGTVSGAGDYQEGEQVPITATASAGYQFVNWNMGEEVISEASSFTYTMPAEDVTLTAHFEAIPMYSLTLTVSPADAGTVSGAGDYEEGAQVPITATASAGYQFVSWNMGEEVISEAAIFSYTMPAEDVTLMAHFEEIPMYSLTLTVSPADAGTVSGAGDYEEGAQVPITATASAGYQFVSWNMGEEVISEASSFTYTMPAEDVTLTAHFEAIPMYSLTLTVSPADAGTVSGAGDYEEGAQVPITATASAGYQFVSWNMGEEVISEASSFTYTMPAEDVTLTAHFEAIPMYSLTLTVSPADAGTVTGAGDYEEGAQVPITATPSAGYQFVSWNMGEEVISEASSFTYTMPAEDVTLTAHFEAIPMYSLTLTVSPADAGTVSGAGDYEEGAQVPITATASAGYQFVSWNMGEEVISEASSFTYTMPAEDVTLTAVFNTEEPTYLVTFSVLYPDNSNIIGAVITIDDIYELVTDENGASIELPGGSYGYIVRYLDFSPQEGEFIVQDQDVSIVIFFPFSDYSITFNVVNQVQEAIEGAKISIEGIEEELYTDHNGHGTIELYFGHYTFSVSANEYQIYNGEFIAFQQQEFSVNVEMIPVSVESHYFLNLQVYPNPFSNTITILNSSGIRSVFITNLIGQKVMDIELSGGELETIQTEGLVKGIYLITFQAENGERLVRKMVKE